MTPSSIRRTRLESVSARFSTAPIAASLSQRHTRCKRCIEQDSVLKPIHNPSQKLLRGIDAARPFHVCVAWRFCVIQWASVAPLSLGCQYTQFSIAMTQLSSKAAKMQFRICYMASGRDNDMLTIRLQSTLIT
eukprot:scaffold175314_cov37-Prasinocladus_malaysianus.AAC.4